MAEGDAGLRPEGEGWFVVNVAEAEGIHTENYGDGVRFEGAERFPDFGINIRLLEPGQPASVYHSETRSEAFVVLSGECVAVIEDEERRLEKGDVLSTPAGTAHVIVGAGDGPSSVLMVGARGEDVKASFPVSEVAAKYGASVAEETEDATQAYRETRQLEPGNIGLPW